MVQRSGSVAFTKRPEAMEVPVNEDIARQKALAKFKRHISPVLEKNEEPLDVLTGMAPPSGTGDVLRVLVSPNLTKAGVSAGFVALWDRLIYAQMKLTGVPIVVPYGALVRVRHNATMFEAAVRTASGVVPYQLFGINEFDARRFYETLLRVSDLTAEDPASPVVEADESATARDIRSLARLRDDGLISADEFESKKTQLLEGRTDDPKSP